MAQGSVISASRRNPLRPFLFRCSISSQLMSLPAVAERRIEHTMKRAENRQTESSWQIAIMVCALNASVGFAQLPRLRRQDGGMRCDNPGGIERILHRLRVRLAEAGRVLR
jgi:hypothetical protein